MNNIYYNPETMSHPGTTLTNVHEADFQDQMTIFRSRMHKPYASRTEALAEDYSCTVFFYESNTIYEAYRTGAWQYKPCTDVEYNSGINWDTYYAVTAERLREYLAEHYETLLNFAPTLNRFGLYEIQVHYDGRCR